MEHIIVENKKIYFIENEIINIKCNLCYFNHIINRNNDIDTILACFSNNCVNPEGYYVNEAEYLKILRKNKILSLYEKSELDI